jgi:hypothetical protein
LKEKGFDFSLAEKTKSGSNGCIEIRGFSGLRVVEEERVHEDEEFPKGHGRGKMWGEERGFGVGGSGSDDPLKDVVECCVVVLTGGGTESTPYVAMVRRGFNVEVVKPEEDGSPGGSLSEGEG